MLSRRVLSNRLVVVDGKAKQREIARRRFANGPVHIYEEEVSSFAKFDYESTGESMELVLRFTLAKLELPHTRTLFTSQLFDNGFSSARERTAPQAFFPVDGRAESVNITGRESSATFQSRIVLLSWIGRAEATYVVVRVLMVLRRAHIRVGDKCGAAPGNLGIRIVPRMCHQNGVRGRLTTTREAPTWSNHAIVVQRGRLEGSSRRQRLRL